MSHLTIATVDRPPFEAGSKAVRKRILTTLASLSNLEPLHHEGLCKRLPLLQLRLLFA